MAGSPRGDGDGGGGGGTPGARARSDASTPPRSPRAGLSAPGRVLVRAESTPAEAQAASQSLDSRGGGSPGSPLSRINSAPPSPGSSSGLGRESAPGRLSGRGLPRNSPPPPATGVAERVVHNLSRVSKQVGQLNPRALNLPSDLITHAKSKHMNHRRHKKSANRRADFESMRGGSPAGSPFGGGLDRNRSLVVEDCYPDVLPPTKFKDFQNNTWQRHPRRLLKYHAGTLHNIGSVPLTLSALKASVLGRPGLHIQSFAYFAWAFCIHCTGLGLSINTRVAMVEIVGTGYLGAMFNFSMVVVFALGLFVSSVISRWWDMRDQYAVLRSTSVDLAVMVCSFIQPPARVGQKKIECNKLWDEETDEVKATLIRYLNLGHVLLLLQVGGGISGLAAGEAQGCWPCAATPKPVEGTDLAALLEGSGTYLQGFIKPDEIEALSAMAGDKYVLVYQWISTLLRDVADTGRLVYAPLMLPTLYKQISAVRAAGARIITYVGTQLPYTYVALLDMTVKIYLTMYATWTGNLLSVGYSATVCYPESGGAFPDHRGGAFLTLNSSTVDCNVYAEATQNKELYHGIGEGVFGPIFCYCMLLVANLVFQGLIDTHTLLDNPFSRETQQGQLGQASHPCKFALRNYVQMMVQTTNDLLDQSNLLPSDARVLRDAEDFERKPIGILSPDGPSRELDRMSMEFESLKESVLKFQDPTA